MERIRRIAADDWWQTIAREDLVDARTAVKQEALPKQAAEAA